MKKVVNYLFQGILLTAPLGITIYIIYYLFTVIDNLLKGVILDYFEIDIPGLGLLILILLLILIGMIGQSIIGRPFINIFNRLITKVPLLKVIYSALNDLFSAFVGKEKKFNNPVLVMVDPKANLERLGFLTRKDLSNLNETEKVAVYFPFSYSFAGELYIVPSSQVRSIDVNPAEVMKFIISAGVSDLESEVVSNKKSLRK
ncbi:MAG: hypothetical protein C0598_08140 [Marinilabiliales bacterium]|nr:MAG: hypothetical protein C0598_08140 [Marinilabiliales bacterium]